MTANLRSKLHVYGFGHLTEEVTWAGGLAYVDYSADDSNIYADTSYTDNNNSFIGYIGTGTTNTDLAT